MSETADSIGPDKDRPLVTIGLPVYNGMPYLKDSITSLQNQDEQNIRIVVSDNASLDDTGAYCRSVAERDPRVRYFRNAVNIGSAANFSRVLSLSDSPFFAWAAHDDVYARNFISRSLELLSHREDAALCVAAHRRVDERGRVLSIRQEPPGMASSDLATRLSAHLARRGWLTLYGLWRRSVFERIGFPQPIWGSDVVLVWRALLLSPILTIDEPLSDYRVFREKTADATMFSLTGSEARLHFPNTHILGELKRACEDMGLNDRDRKAAEGVLRRWVVTRHYRELAFSDLWLESRRYWSEGARIRALCLLPPLAVLSPRMSLRGLHRMWERRREQDAPPSAP